MKIFIRPPALLIKFCYKFTMPVKNKNRLQAYIPGIDVFSFDYNAMEPSHHTFRSGF